VSRPRSTTRALPPLCRYSFLASSIFFCQLYDSACAWGSILRSRCNRLVTGSDTRPAAKEWLWRPEGKRR
jgi:hypothetical protein